MRAFMTRDVKMYLQQDNLPVLERIVRRRFAANDEQGVIENNLMIQLEESQGYNPYDNPGPAPAADSE